VRPVRGTVCPPGTLSAFSALSENLAAKRLELANTNFGEWEQWLSAPDGLRNKRWDTPLGLGLAVVRCVLAGEAKASERRAQAELSALRAALCDAQAATAAAEARGAAAAARAGDGASAKIRELERRCAAAERDAERSAAAAEAHVAAASKAKAAAELAQAERRNAAQAALSHRAAAEREAERADRAEAAAAAAEAALAAARLSQPGPPILSPVSAAADSAVPLPAEAAAEGSQCVSSAGPSPQALPAAPAAAPRWMASPATQPLSRLAQAGRGGATRPRAPRAHNGGGSDEADSAREAAGRAAARKRLDLAPPPPQRALAERQAGGESTDLFLGLWQNGVGGATPSMPRRAALAMQPALAGWRAGGEDENGM